MKIEIPPKYKTKKEKLGYIGEILVQMYFGGTLSEWKYDPKKDLILPDGLLAEVKTQNRDKYRNLFSVNTMQRNQVEKCCNADRLFFVEYDKTDTVKIWECVDRTYQFYVPNDGRNMVGWPINKMNKLVEIEDKELSDQMKSLSQSRDFSLDSPYAFNKF